MKTIQIIKNITYLVLGILIIIFNRFCLSNIVLVIGGIMLLNAAEDITTWSIKGYAKEGTRFFDALILLILALVLFLVRDDFEKCMIIFGAWMILGEGREITDCVMVLKNNKYALLDVAESIGVIIMSILLILNPTEHHAHIHVFILGAELLAEVAFYYMYQYLDKKSNKAKEIENGREEE